MLHSHREPHTHTHFVMCTINGTLSFSACVVQHFKTWNINWVCLYTDRARCWRHPRTSLWNEDIQKLDASIVRVEMQEKNKSVLCIILLRHEQFSDFFFLFLFCLSFVTAQCGLQFSSRGVRPGVTTVLARHLDKNTMGYLQWRWGIQSSMNTSVVRDTKSSHFTFAMQVSSFNFKRSPRRH